MKIGMHHTGTYCKDIDESIKFYCDVLNFDLLFTTTAWEGDKPLKMAWVKNDNTVIELLEQVEKTPLEATAQSLNHLAIRIENMDDFVKRLAEFGIPIEAGPFDADCTFDRPLSDDVTDVFTAYGPKGAHLKIMFFRGPGNERIEAVQDDVGAIE